MVLAQTFADLVGKTLVGGLLRLPERFGGFGRSGSDVVIMFWHSGRPPQEEISTVLPTARPSSLSARPWLTALRPKSVNSIMWPVCL
ncbi:hypothetical protein AOX55_00006476 (plasmid) [Sinorhizobium fredii CCBAU 25509]|nr:hypothetical protein SF83666_b50140 [Sinorhizobium fredii CCBAU 83666]AWM29251.1 hypothetical protein AOX55_00006476 [Sinorhizobium fredii CCBAU 25509]